MSEKLLTAEEALNQASTLRAEVSERLDEYLEQRSRGRKEAVIDFMFEYYRFRPAHLMQWSPGLGCSVQKTARTEELLSVFDTIMDAHSMAIKPKRLKTARINALKWLIELQTSILSRPHIHHCYGLHEWAMLYKTQEARHPYLDLRVSELKIQETVEAQPLVCTHFDAFRFYTDEAKPLNMHELQRESMIEHEQGGCIHNNMDLYKWAHKFYPMTSSRLIWDSFKLALEARVVDMEASPYDVQPYGYSFIPIETKEGRKVYAERQRSIAEKASSLRKRLLNELQLILNKVETQVGAD
jgi:hypothetical protein